MIHSCIHLLHVLLHYFSLSPPSLIKHCTSSRSTTAFACTAGSPEVGLGNNYDQPPAGSKLNSFHQKQKWTDIFFMCFILYYIILQMKKYDRMFLFLMKTVQFWPGGWLVIVVAEANFWWTSCSCSNSYIHFVPEVQLFLLFLQRDVSWNTHAVVLVAWQVAMGLFRCFLIALLDSASKVINWDELEAFSTSLYPSPHWCNILFLLTKTP